VGSALAERSYNNVERNDMAGKMGSGWASIQREGEGENVSLYVGSTFFVFYIRLKCLDMWISR
jgi:hypothetical protein